MFFIYFKRIKELRIEKKLTQKEIAEILYLQTRTYQRYENVDRDTPNQILLMIADLYNVSLDYIFERSENRNLK